MAKPKVEKLRQGKLDPDAPRSTTTDEHPVSDEARRIQAAALIQALEGPDAFENFEGLTERLLTVPKPEVDKKEQERKKRR